MLVKMGQNAINNKTPRTSMSTLPASQPTSWNGAWGKLSDGDVAGPRGAGASCLVDMPASRRSGLAGASIVVIILPLAIAAEIVVGKHRSEQRQSIFLDSLIGFQSALPVGNAGS